MNKLRIHRTLSFVISCFLMLCCSLGLSMNIRDSAASEFPPIHPGYPSEYDAVGVVDNVGSDYIVINDSAFRFTKNAAFNGPNGSVHRGSFQPGDKVGVILTDKHQIASLWLMETSVPMNKNNTTLRQEGEIWKN